MDRNGIILSNLDRTTSNVLEIGPSFSPIAPKRDGWRTTVVDYTDRAGLVEKYSRFAGLDLGAIEEVDIIWPGGNLHDAVSINDRGRFDALIASHVIEHIPDIVSFLESADRLVSPNGQLLLAVPDLRLCFDCMRPTSTTGQVVAAWREKRSRHAWSAVFDAHAYDARPPNGDPSWSRSAQFRPRLTGELSAVARNLEGYRDEGDGEYLDVHGWTFTPSSFSLILLELELLGLSQWSIVSLEECEAVEFLVTLERRKKGELPIQEVFADQRCELLVRRWQELREQADWMLGSSEAKKLIAAAAASEPNLQNEIEELRQVTIRWESLARSL